ncbi:MAG TPA: hypothetical protein PK239_00725 [Chitinophagales bacterium]|mgnify:CR=1 FL=1|nr:hypothetical protein [Chitinophagales bacterium]HRK25786.1 hypothetical protein [Chitinophagales bacterium]
MAVKPYISFVVTSRNDQHGHHLQERTALFMRGLITQCTRFGLAAELIVVEWNPPPQAPPLAEVLPKPPAGCPLAVSYLTVPAHIHRRYRLAHQMGLYQMIAKNAGIRRANADFVLCTNVDLLFSDDLMAFLARKKLQPDTLYRADRCDVPNTLLQHPHLPIEQQLQWCSRHITKRHTRNRLLLAPLNALICADKQVFKRYLKRRLPLLYLLHLATDACGDFTLLHKNVWNKIQGYPELDLYSAHIDTLGIAAAIAIGCKQVQLPRRACVYHIHHADGWASLSPIQKLQYVENHPALGLDTALQAALHCLKHQTTYQINTPHWGLATENLPHTTITPAP